MTVLRLGLETAPCAPPIGVAVSGGGDSVALFHLLLESGWNPGHLHVLHVHHGLREAADEEAAHVRALAERAGCPFEVLGLDPATVRGGISADRLRSLRFAALETVVHRRGLSGVALAHTADDQRETRWLALIRGSGLRGLAGMRDWVAPFWRPLLRVGRATLREYLNEKNVSWREDATNVDFHHLRARVRHVLLPNVGRPLTAAEHLRVQMLQDEDDYLEAEAARVLSAVAAGPVLRVPPFRRYTPAVQRRVLRMWTGQRQALERLESLRKVLSRPASRVRFVELPGSDEVVVGTAFALRSGGVPAPRELGPGTETVLAWGAFGELRVAAPVDRGVFVATVASAVRRGMDLGGAAAGVYAEWREVWPAIGLHGSEGLWIPAHPLSRSQDGPLGQGSVRWIPSATWATE